MQFSVIIPAYNEENYLTKCLESLKKQTFHDFEIIVVDNSSKDNTKRVAQQFTKKVYTCKKQGAGPARNFGVEKAKGEILCFLDADVTVPKNWLENIHKSFSGDKHLDGITGNIIYNYKDKLSYFLINSIMLTGSIFIVSANKLGMYIMLSNNMAIKRKIFHKTQGFPATLQEHMKFSYDLRKIKGLKIRFSYKMKHHMSPRRFEKYGFLRTQLQWIICIFKDVRDNRSEENYE